MVIFEIAQLSFLPITFGDFDICKVCTLFVDLAKVHSAWSDCLRAKCYKSCVF